MVSLFDPQGHFACLTVFDPETARLPAIPNPRPDDVDHLISRLCYIGGGGSFRARGMGVKDAKQVEPVGFDPIESFELFIGIHYESHGTLCLIPYPDDFLHPVIRTRQQAARLQWNVAVNMTEHLLPVLSIHRQLPDHLI